MRNLLIIIISLIIFGCNQKNITEPSINYFIEKIEPDETFVGDTVSIYGNDFGMPVYSSKLLIKPGISLQSDKVILWQNQKIIFIVPENSQTGSIEVFVMDSLVGTVHLTINRTPPFDTEAINSGSFLMGSESGSEDELPIHNVTISNSLEVFTYEVSARLFKSVMGFLPSGNDDIHLPVRNVRWIEAVKFSNELSKIQNLDTCYVINESFVDWNDTTDGWRLPTEAEWEYLAKAGNNYDFPNNGELDEYGWFSQNSGLKIHPGGRKKANEFGLYDMNGNVWEWCWDYYGRDYYASSSSTAPKGPATGNTRVKRGGSAVEGSYFSRNSARKSAENNINNTGIRLVRTIKN